MFAAGGALLLCVLAAEVKLTNQQQLPETRFKKFPSKKAPDSFSTDKRFKAVFAGQNVDRPLRTATIHDLKENSTYHVGLSKGDKILDFVWTSGSSYVFAQSVNIYFVESPGQKPIRMSTDEDAGRNIVYADFNLSPSGKYLAYTSSAAPKTVVMTSYSEDEPHNYQYENDYTVPGEKLELPTVSIWSVEEKKSITMDVQLSNKSSFHTLHKIKKWAKLHGQEIFIAIWANRYFNKTAITLCTFQSKTCSLLYEHNYNYSQWGGLFDYITQSSNTSLFFLLPHTVDDNAWQHVAKLDVSTDFRFESISFLPSRAYDINHILGYRPAEDIIIFDAQAPHPWDRHVYATPAGNSSRLKEDRCLTCGVSNCTYHENVHFSNTPGLALSLHCFGPGPNYDATYSYDSTFELSGIKITSNMSTADITEPEWITEILQLENGYEAIVRIYEGDKALASVPVTLAVYGGPNMNVVSDNINVYNGYEVMHIGYKHAIVYIDVRGSGGRGWKYRSPIYRGLLTVEVQDTLEALKIVLEKYPRLDRKRVGVAGFSYGGSMTTALVEAAPSFFKCAIVGAPVMNFTGYYAEYSETYMGDTPASEYPDLTRNVSAFAHTDLLLVHGLRDGKFNSPYHNLGHAIPNHDSNNVLFRQSALLIEALQKADILFQLMVYPNQDHQFPDPRKAHEFSGKHVRHLYESFLSTCYA